MSIKGDEKEAIESGMYPLAETGDDTGGPSPRIVTADQRDANLVTIDHPDLVVSVAFLAGGKEVMSGGSGGNIRRWRTEDGMEVDMPIDAGSSVRHLVVSRDGKWVVAGTYDGQVVVWKSTNFEKEIDFKAHGDEVNVVDISVDGTKIATGSDDRTVSVWSLALPTGERLLGPLKHYNWLVAVKFSPDGKFIATATYAQYSVRIYDSLDGTLLKEFPIFSGFNRSLAWTGNGEQVYVLSSSGNIYCLDVSSKSVLSQWSIHSDDNPYCITLACDGACIAVSANSSVSFWDTTTHHQIGPVIDYPHDVSFMTISENYDMVTAGDKTIMFRNLHGVLPTIIHQPCEYMHFEVRWLSETAVLTSERTC
jgi:WD40 repeat protein